MAFRLPTQVPRRQPSYSTSRPPTLDIPDPSQLADNDSAQWVLFSPSQPPSAAHTHTSSTERTRRTAGRLSDFGSFGTATRSAGIEEGGENGEDIDEALDEDGTELDSLDDDLHAFRAPSLAQDPSPRLDHGATMLPAHDGLGSFHASSQLVQDQLWQHEQYNPSRRVHLRNRRHSSVQRQLDAAAANETVDQERERWQRIENWRMDQSRVVLEEIERQTRRRGRGRTSRSSREGRGELDSVPETQTPGQQSSEVDEPLWRRVRRLVRDLIGIDDSLLSVIFGESVPFADDRAETRLSSSSGPLDIDQAMKELDSGPWLHEELWQTKLLHRIARELGTLVHQLYEHPGAFTTYLNVTRNIPNEYAGMPLGQVPEDTQASETANSGSIMSPRFGPTLQDPGKEHAAHWGIEDDEESNRLASDDRGESLPESARLQQEKDYWERELDVMMVFRYLWNRFGRRGSTEPNYSPRRHIDPSRRAAIIRQHHPLVARAHSRTHAQNRGQSQSQSVGYSGPGPTGISSPLLRQRFRRPSSSCASQSAKLSGISSKRTMTGSSRNYWDIGGSVESGSAVVGWEV